MDNGLKKEKYTAKDLSQGNRLRMMILDAIADNVDFDKLVDMSSVLFHLIPDDDEIDKKRDPDRDMILRAIEIYTANNEKFEEIKKIYNKLVP